MKSAKKLKLMLAGAFCLAVCVVLPGCEEEKTGMEFGTIETELSQAPQNATLEVSGEAFNYNLSINRPEGESATVSLNLKKYSNPSTIHFVSVLSGDDLFQQAANGEKEGIIDISNSGIRQDATQARPAARTQTAAFRTRKAAVLHIVPGASARQYHGKTANLQVFILEKRRNHPIFAMEKRHGTLVSFNNRTNKSMS